MSGIRGRETDRRSAAAAARARGAGARGFSVIELAVVLVILGLVIGPLLTLVGTQLGASRTQQTREALETARDALVAFAADHNGCLPVAADHEGGLPDTGADGTAGYTDTGARPSQRTYYGDLPWADLGLGKDFLDGDGLRIQYYVASPYVDKDNDKKEIVCIARFFGFPWKSDVRYEAPSQAPLYVYANAPQAGPTSGPRTLYKIKKSQVLPAGTHPDDGANVASSVQLPNPLLEVRRGPDVLGADDQKVSAQNVFVLIAPGDNLNTKVSRRYVRDANHYSDPGDTTWELPGSPTSNIDTAVFSATPDTSAADPDEHGDDTILYMSFTAFKAALIEYRMHMEPVVCSDC